MFSALERFETLALSALLDVHLALKMDTSPFKDKQQSCLLWQVVLYDQPHTAD